MTGNGLEEVLEVGEAEDRISDYSDLRVVFQEIRRIEANLKLIEGGEV